MRRERETAGEGREGVGLRFKGKNATNESYQWLRPYKIVLAPVDMCEEGTFASRHWQFVLLS